jgi:hypothetical protein
LSTCFEAATYSAFYLPFFYCARNFTLTKATATKRRIIEEVIRLAAPREMRLYHCDALVLMSRTSFAAASEASAYSALDYAESAQHLAQVCGYAWGERDACRVLQDALESLGEHKRAAVASKRATALDKRLSDW